MSSSKERSGGGSGSRTCQDCGNKSKKDCEHKRCRSCCKSKGFTCPTHVRSTWVPVARRHQLLHQRLAAAASALPLHLITTPSTSSSGFQGRAHSFPAEVNSVANFRCVRVFSDDNAVDKLGYQSSVHIGGHVFSGILYDQGPCLTSSGGGGGGGGGVGESSSSDQYLRHHQLVGMATSTARPGGGGGGGGVGGSSGGANPPYLYPHQYPFYASNAPFILPGMHFFPHPIQKPSDD